MPDIDTKLAIGLAVGFGALNLLIGITWLTCLHQNRKAKRRLLLAAGTLGSPIDIEKQNQNQKKKKPSLLLKRTRSSRNHPAYIISGTAQSQSQTHRPDIRIVDVVNTPLTHFEDHDYLARDHFTPPPKPQTKKRRSKDSTTTPSFALDSPFNVGLKPPVGFASLRDQCQRSTPVGALKRAGSKDTFDTASVYSMASANGDMHERITSATATSRARLAAHQPFSARAMGAYINSPLTPVPEGRHSWLGRDGGGGGLVVRNVSMSQCLSRESITPTYPIATKPTLTPHYLDFINPLSPDPASDNSNERRWGMYLPDAHQGLQTPTRPRTRPMSTADSLSLSTLSKDRLSSLQLSPTSPPPASELLPDHLKLDLKPVAPLSLKKKNTVRSLHREDTTVGRPLVLPSPHSPPPPSP